MKIVVAIFADFENAFLGGPSRLRETLVGEEILARTLKRSLRIEGVAGHAVIVRARDEQAARRALSDYGLADRVQVVACDDGLRPRRELMRSARIWNLDGWRGSPLGTTWFDEFVEPRVVLRSLDVLSCDGLLCIDGHQPLLDVSFSNAMVCRAVERDAETPLVATQAPPGLTGLLMKRPITEEFVRQNTPAGLLFAYRPEAPRPDPITRPFFLQLDGLIVHTKARLVADTRRAREWIAAALTQLGEECSATEICAWIASGGAPVDTLPREVEIELTTDHPLPNSTLRPPHDRIPVRRLDGLNAIRALAARLAEYDDRRVILGGHGDPLLSPFFPEVCATLRRAGVCGLAVVSPLIELSDAALEGLFTARVDVVEVTLDANTPEMYREIHGVDGFARVIANMDRVQALRRERISPQPLLLPSLTRCAKTLPELEAFYDRWVGLVGGAVIHGHSERCGTMASDPLPQLVPPVRRPCRRVGDQLTLLANGVVASCDQDVAAVAPLGKWDVQDPLSIWRSAAHEAFRVSHSKLEFDRLPACAHCRAWY